MDEPLFHIASSAAWARPADPYLPPDFEREGFVHCSTRRQVIHVANALFRGRSDLLLLMIDASRIEAPVRYENLSGGLELFPHVYSGLPRRSIVAVEPLELRSDGSFEPTAVERCMSMQRSMGAMPAA